MYNVQCTMYNVQCTMYNVQCTMYNVQCTMYNVQCTMYNVQCTYMEKAHVAASNFWAFLRSFCLSTFQFLGVFMQFCPSLPQKMNFCRLSDHQAFSMYDNVQCTTTM